MFSVVPSLALIMALRAVESSNGLDVRAHGNELQITPICVRDVNRIYGTHYSILDAQDFGKSTEIARLYLSHWGNKRTKATPPTDEVFARIWHRGPTKWQDAQGGTYWRKVRVHLKTKEAK